MGDQDVLEVGEEVDLLDQLRPPDDVAEVEQDRGGGGEEEQGLRRREGVVKRIRSEQIAEEADRREVLPVAEKAQVELLS